VLRLRYPNLKRAYKTPFFPVPQILGSAGMIFAFIQIFPDPVIRQQIFRWSGTFLAGAVVYSVIWIKAVMKEPLFTPTSIDVAIREWAAETEDEELATFGEGILAHAEA
jgi:hypothetical protein